MPGGHDRGPRPRQQGGSDRLHRRLQRLLRQLLPCPAAIRQCGPRPHRLRRRGLHAGVRCAGDIRAAVHHVVTAGLCHVPGAPHPGQYGEVPGTQPRGSMRGGGQARAGRRAQPPGRRRLSRGRPDGPGGRQLLPGPGRVPRRWYRSLVRDVALRDAVGDTPHTPQHRTRLSSHNLADSKEVKTMLRAARWIGAIVASGIVWSAPALAADSINGQVLGGGRPIAGSSVTLWSTSPGAPKQLAKTRTGPDGRFTLPAARGSVVLYLVARGGRPTVSASIGENPVVALMAVVGVTPPARVTINEMTTIASV